MTNTIQYYEKHAKKKTEKTINTNMTKTYNMFEKYLKPNDHILDLGCGSGRDTKHFITNYHVTALDPVKAFLNNVPENINKLTVSMQLLLSIKNYLHLFVAPQHKGQRNL